MPTKTLGLKIPQSLLLRADQVIEQSCLPIDIRSSACPSFDNDN